MFGDFKDAWRQAVDNFWQELKGDEAMGDERVRSAYREVARARNQLERLDAEIGDSKQRLVHEREQVEVCARRQRMAEGIGDAETARIADDYGARHRERAEVLERKLEALEAERRLCRRDLDEMEEALQAWQVEVRRPELEDLSQHPRETEFRGLEESERERSAAERLEDLKRRMGQQ